ncbi:MAG: PTS sugar transporter subunit IIC, partial [Lachnospiraceae bacterium]|nr:PTS sugar transporter subunit IIC [Lachnospiraceae bacterium]
MRVKEFLKKKDIVISPKRYGIDALSQMAQAVFASLLIGLIFKTIGEQGHNFLGEYEIFTYFTELGSFAMKQVGAAIGIAVAWALKAPPLV